MAGAGGASAPKSFDEGLTAVYQDVSALALSPDAAIHMPFVQTLQNGILQYRQQMMQQKAQQAAQAQQQMAQQAAAAQGQVAGQAAGMPQGGMGSAMGAGVPGGGQGGGGPQGMPGGGQMGPGSMPPGAPQPTPGAPNQIQPGGGAGMSGYGGVATNVDELSRILRGPAGLGGAG